MSMTIRLCDMFVTLDVVVLNDNKKLSDLLNKYGNEEKFAVEEERLFLFKEDDIWLAIDNLNSELYIEEFQKLENALSYLLGDNEYYLTQSDKRMLEQCLKDYHEENLIGDLIYYCYFKKDI